MTKHIDIVFDAPPGPESGRFVEVENSYGHSIKFGEWVEREDGYFVIRFSLDDVSGHFQPQNNRFSFADVAVMTDAAWLAKGEKLELSPAQIIDLQDEIESRKESLKSDSALLQSLLAEQNGKKAAEVYAIEKKDSGKITVSLSPEFDLLLDRSKKVDWDQKKLTALAKDIKDGGDDPAVYIVTETELSVKEAAYASWPDEVREAFFPARTVKVGDTKYTVQPKKKAK